eukprot:468049-Alexandrium_andersonii.AAC.1
MHVIWLPRVFSLRHHTTSCSVHQRLHDDSAAVLLPFTRNQEAPKYGPNMDWVKTERAHEKPSFRLM